MAHPHNFYTLGNNQWLTFSSPPPPSLGLYPTITFVATDPSHPAGVALGGSPGSPTLGGHNSVWNLDTVIAGDRSQNHEFYGQVELETRSGTVDLVHGVHLWYGNVTLSTYYGGAGAFVLNGASTVANYSTLTAQGGHYGAIGFGDPFYVNGTMSVTDHSVADFDDATLAGTGSIHVGSGSIVDARTLVAGLHMDVDKGGALFLLNPNDAGRISLAAGAAVYVAGVTTAAREIFHEASGTLDLLNKSGDQVASLKFAPGSHEYTSRASLHGDLLKITTNPMLPGHLPATFVS